MDGAVKIFLADPSQDFVDLLSAALAEQPDLAVVGTAVSGDAALALLSQERPDVLVLNLLLPGLDGLSLLRRLKTGGAMPRTLVLSAFVTDRVAQAAALLGVEDYLPKPCDLPVLVRRIREIGGGTACPRIDDYDHAIREALLHFGINSNLSGYTYLREGIYRAIEDRNVLRGITKILYPDLAKQFNTRAICVERAIRGAVDKAWQRGSPDARRAYFGAVFDSFERSPTNIRFITAIADFIELEFEKDGVWKTN